MITNLRFFIIIAFSFLIISSLIAHQRVLLRINKEGQQETIPLRKGERTEDVLLRLDKINPQAPASSIKDSIVNFGPNGATNFIASHQDVMFQWFDPMDYGLVLEFGWKNGVDVGTIPKSTIRAWNGNIKLLSLPTNAVSTSGSGLLGNMGYYKKADDSDGLKTPFKDESTDTNFVGGKGDSLITRFDPLGTEAKWLIGGRQFSLVPNAWQSFKLLDFGDSMEFRARQPFGFTKQNDTKISDIGGVAGDVDMLIGANSADQYPFHSIKFTEGTPTSNYGWQIRDYEWNMYVIVEYTESPPPMIINFTRLQTTLKTTPRTVNATVRSGDAPGFIPTVDLFYKINSNAYFKSPMTGTEPNYTGTLPGANPGDTVTYYISATYPDNLTVRTVNTTYTIFKPTKNVLYLWNGRSLPAAFTSPTVLATYGMMKDSMKEKVYYDVWDVRKYGISDIPILLGNYYHVVEATGDGGYADLTGFAGTWLATGSSWNPKIWFWSDQDHGIISNFADTTFLDTDPHAKYFGVKALINQDYPYAANGNAIVTKPWQLDLVAKTDTAFAYIDTKMTKDTVTYWYDPNHEMPPFLNWMDEFTPTASAKVIFKDKKNNAKVVGVQNSASDGSWHTVWLAFDYLSTNFRSDTSTAKYPTPRTDPKYKWILDVGNPIRAFVLQRTIVGSSQIAVAVPSKFALQQNYPNPFNPVTVISYQLAANSFVTVRVYDLLGREVATLVNEQKPAGNYTVQWDAEHFTSGVYFYRLQAGSFSDTKKLLLLK